MSWAPLLILILAMAWASPMVNCPPNFIRIWSQSVGYTCMPRMNLPEAYDPYGCFSHNGLLQDPAAARTFYGPSYRGGNSPWWAAPAKIYYPNVNYPGAWAYPNISSHYYPGQGQVFAAKPNVYIQSVRDSASFEFKFTSEERLSFLATTPPLEKERVWSGKIIDKDKFEVEGAYYDYLFYDIRLPKEKLQFERGLCSTREGAIEWMLGDLKEMNYPLTALQDFEEHWRVKIPDYPYYCIYPQYNHELDKVLPVNIELAQTTFTRSLYVLLPFKKEPDIDHPHPDAPFPQNDPSIHRPSTKITRENMFKEWGVAFLGTE